MKKLNLIILLISIFYLNYSFAQCPRGRVNSANCCGAHYDANKNFICDYSEVKTVVESEKEPEKEVKKVEVVSVEKNLTVAQHDKSKSCAGCKHKCSESSENVEAVASSEEDEFKSMDEEVDTTSVTATELEAIDKPKEKPYSLIFISLLTFGLYAFTWALAKLKKIKLSLHRKIWNVILFLTFLVSCLFGFFLVIQLNYDFVMDWYKTLIYWHVQFGIAMTIIAFFHAIWHTKYYINMFKQKKN